MNAKFTVRPERARELIETAARSHAPLSLTFQSKAGWQHVKARLDGMDEGSDLLRVEAPAGDASALPEIGQNIGVSFRSGHRKCVFNTSLVDQRPGQAAHRIELRLLIPESVHELQRRLYYRTPVPAVRLVPVDVWLAQGKPAPQAENNLPQRGRMLDLSAGGVSLELPREVRPRWRNDDTLSCRFATDSNGEPVEIPARLCHYDRTSDGHVRLGLQFVGLDTTVRGRQIMQRIHQMTNRLRCTRK